MKVGRRQSADARTTQSLSRVRPRRRHRLILERCLVTLPNTYIYHHPTLYGDFERPNASRSSSHRHASGVGSPTLQTLERHIYCMGGITLSSDILGPILRDLGLYSLHLLPRQFGAVRVPCPGLYTISGDSCYITKMVYIAGTIDEFINIPSNFIWLCPLNPIESLLSVLASLVPSSLSF